MNEPREKTPDARPLDDPNAPQAGPATPVRRDVEPARAFERSLALGDLDVQEFARLLADPSTALEQRLAPIVRWMNRVERRVSLVESRLAALTSQASDQEEAIKMMCTVLKDMDDPYGFGLSLDERIAGGGEWAPEDEEE